MAQNVLENSQMKQLTSKQSSPIISQLLIDNTVSGIITAADNTQCARNADYHQHHDTTSRAAATKRQLTS